MKIKKDILNNLLVAVSIVVPMFSYACAVNNKDYHALIEQYEFMIKIRKAEHEICVYKIDEPSVIVGRAEFLVDSKGNGYISDISIERDFRGLGLGSILLQLIIKIMNDRQSKQIGLWALPQDLNDQELDQFDEMLSKLKRFYGYFGFVVDDTGGDISGNTMRADKPFKLSVVPVPSFKLLKK